MQHQGKYHLLFLWRHKLTVKINEEMKITGRQLSSSSFYEKGNAGSFGISCYIPKSISEFLLLKSLREGDSRVTWLQSLEVHTTGFGSVFISMYSLCKAVGFTVTSSWTHEQLASYSPLRHHPLLYANWFFFSQEGFKVWVRVTNNW